MKGYAFLIVKGLAQIVFTRFPASRLFWNHCIIEGIENQGSRNICHHDKYTTEARIRVNIWEGLWAGTSSSTRGLL